VLQAATTTSFDEQRVVRIGRSRDSDIVLDSPSISAVTVSCDDGDGWDLVDIGSAGGTWIKRSARHARVARRDDDGALRAVRDGVAAYITIALPQAAADGPPMTKARPYSRMSTLSCSPTSSAPTSTDTVNPRRIIPSTGY